MEKHNAVNLEIYGQYKHPPEEGEFFHPKIFMSYKGSKKKEVQAYTCGYINKAAVIIMQSPKNPDFRINFSSGPKEEQFEALIKKFNKKERSYFMYCGELRPSLQKWLTKYLTDRGFIGRIKKDYQTASKISKKLNKAEDIVSELEKQSKAIWNKIYIHDKKIPGLESHLFNSPDNIILPETIIKPWNSINKTKNYITAFARKGVNIYNGLANFGKELTQGTIVLITNPNKFYYLDKFNREESVCTQVLGDNVKEMKGTPAKLIKGSSGRFGGYLGESPWDIFQEDLEFLCRDGKKRFMMNYSEGEGYIFLPHPKYLKKFIGCLEEIPRKKIKRDVINQLKNYYKKL